MSLPADPHDLSPAGRSARLDRCLADLLGQAPELEAAAVVSFDGLAMASALPAGMDEDRVAAMSAALLSLGEKAAQGLGRGDLSQVYVEGENGTVFLISAQDEAVLVAVAARGAKTGLMLFEARRAAAAVGSVLAEDAYEVYDYAEPSVQAAQPVEQVQPVEPMASAQSVEPVAVEGSSAVFVADEDANRGYAHTVHEAINGRRPEVDVERVAAQGTWSPYSEAPAQPDYEQREAQASA
jgi:predicted regulator of Ras-like GTPase activity (Roadblock/LC7/MglB family)